MGMQAFCAAAKEAGADGVLLTDMIVEEATGYLAAMHEHDLAPIFLAAPTSPDARLKAIAQASRGFVYAISRVGITGTQDTLASDASQLVARLRQFTQLPIAVGFGVSTPAHVQAVGQFADAAVIGSAIVALIEKTGPTDAAKAVGSFIHELHETASPHPRVMMTLQSNPAATGGAYAMEMMDWRKTIDELDEQIVALLSKRAEAAKAIGAIKRQTAAPIYEPRREQDVFDKVRKANGGPLSDAELLHVYERIMDVMRALQRGNTAVVAGTPATGSTER